MKKLLITALGLLMPLLLLAQGWPSNYGGVMLQGFYWDSYTPTKWTRLTAQADELAQYFDLIWIPQSARAKSSPSMGYDPLYWFSNYNSSFGSEAELRTMISTFKQKGNNNLFIRFLSFVRNDREGIEMTGVTERCSGKGLRGSSSRRR